MSLGNWIGALRRQALSLVRSKRANVAMIFGLSAIPIAIAAGTGIDLSRALVVRARLSEALDAAGLAVGSTSGLSQSEAQALAQQYFSANYRESAAYGTPSAVTATVSGQRVTLSANVPMPTTLMNIVGIHTITVSSTSQVVWGQTKLWVALVLDNTGSMSQTDSSGTSKISALKTATTNLLQTLKGAATNPGDVKVSIVPFTNVVNVGSSNYNATWIDWTDWNAVNGTCSGGNGSTQSVCIVAHCSKSQYTTKTICQSHSGTWYSAGTWTPRAHSNWTGCVMDRTQDYDTQNTTPTSTATDFPAAPSTLSYHTPSGSWSLSCGTLEKLMGLTDVLDSTGWSNLNSEVTNMQAGGATNQTIGLAWGWQTLTDGDPMNAGSLPNNTSQVIILLSDGLNTQDRWTGDGSNQDSSTDARMTQMCTNVKAAGVIIYTVFVDLNGTQGNSTVLQNCASDSSKYFDLTTSGEVVTAFNQIAQQITNLRVAE